jgi:opacity protein-like surface antigen
MLKKINRLFLFFFLFYSISSFAVSVISQVDSEKRHPFYIGLTSGYGATTWGQLVPPQSKANAAISLSTPSSVKEGGAIWGVFAGYELIPTFAVEAAYTRYATADVYFGNSYDQMSFFSILNDGRTQFSTKTEVVSVSGKLMLLIPKTPLKAFSSVGAAGIHRDDILTNHWRLSPTFGVGLDYNITEHIMAELGINYTGGYGESELDPVNDYIPFLYSGFFRLAYRF